MSVVVLVGVLIFSLIAVRHLIPFPLKYWHIMFMGALIYFLSHSITFDEAMKSVDIDVIVSLFGMFSLGFALEESRYLGHIFYKFFKRAENISFLILALIFAFGISSAFFMNDTIAIVGVPVILLLSRNYGLNLKFLTLLLAFSVTTGSILSPLGNPQNLLVALLPVFSNPFVEFFKYLLLPTVLCLFVIYFYMRRIFKEEFSPRPLVHSQEPIKDRKLKRLCKISLSIFFGLILVKVLEFFFKFNFKLRLSWIPLISVLPIYLLYPKRWKILKGVDYDTLLFFVFMFIVTETLTRDKFFTNFLNKPGVNPVSTLALMLNGIFLSQLISNVPFTIFYLKIMKLVNPPLISYIILAFASTIAGNLTILGAASNVIILQNLEKRVKGHVVNFFEFIKYGLPLTVIQVVLFLLCLELYRLFRII
ncbi:MAG: SLC13 family permease [candidate division WOR-3 bacterium]